MRLRPIISLSLPSRDAADGKPLEPPFRPHTMRTLLRTILSFALGVILLIPLGALYGVMGLPVYHSWGLAHGSFTTALPALSATAFVALGMLPWFSRSNDSTPRIVTSLAVLPLVTALFWADQKSQYTFSAWHLGIYGALFCMLSIFFLRSRRPLLLPLFVLIPLLMDPVFGLVIVGSTSQFGIEIFGHALLTKVLPAVLVSGASLLIAHFARKSVA